MQTLKNGDFARKGIMQQTVSLFRNVERARIDYPLENLRVASEIRYQFEQRNGAAGLATLVFERKSTLDEFLLRGLADIGIPNGGLLAYLAMFYPNGLSVPNNSPLMRRGAGSEAFEIILQDAREEGARLMYALPTEYSAKRFFRKKKFRRFKRQELCYLVL